VGVELSRRTLFVLLIILFPREKVIKIGVCIIESTDSNHTQVAVLLLLCLMLAVYGFCLPYRSLAVNFIELTVQINSILLFLLVTSGVLEPYLSLRHPSPVIGRNNTQCKDTSGTSSATWILLPVYYLPALIILIVFTIYSVKLLR